MINFSTYSLILLGSWIFVLIAGIFRYESLDRPSKILFGLVSIGFLTDLIAICFSVSGTPNAVVYNVASLLYTINACAYFGECIKIGRFRSITVYLAVVSIAIWLFNLLAFQPILESNTYFRVYQITLIICLTLASIGSTFIMPVYVNLRKEPHFWFAIILLLFWSFMFLHILTYDYLTAMFPSKKWLIDYSILFCNTCCNLSLAIVFYFSPKMKVSNAATN